MLNILKPIVNKMNRNGTDLREVVIQPGLQPETPKLSEGSEVVDIDTVVKSEIPIEDISDFQK